MRARGLQGVLFDKDGTLFDFEATWRGAAWRLLGLLAPGDTVRQGAIGAALGFDPASGRFVAGSPLVAGSVAQVAVALAPLVPGAGAAAIEAMGNAVAAGIGGTTLAPAAPDLGGLLDGLAARGLSLGVATHDGEASARLHLGEVGVLDRFAFVAGYDSGHGLKPGPGMVLAFTRACGIAAADVAMVGDSVHDLGAGRAAGVRLAVGVLTGPATRADLAPLADVVLGSIAELPDFLSAEGL
jgi:phosphoglycolate phosphatase